MLKIHNKEIKNVCDLREIIEKNTTILTDFKYKLHMDKYNLYMYVVMCGTPEMLKYLETYLSDVKKFKDGRGNDSYLIAAQYGQLEIMKYLEDTHNWNIHIKNNKGSDAYLLASRDGKLEVMTYLEKKHRWNIHTKNNNGSDAYSFALLKGRLNIIKYLDENHKWAIHDYPVEIKDTDILKYLNKIKLKKNMIYIKNISNNDCNICLETFTDGICKCTNGHTFCFDCYSNLDNKIKCCICNQNNMVTEYIFYK
jgi:hypothetical protein